MRKKTLFIALALSAVVACGSLLHASFTAAPHEPPETSAKPPSQTEQSTETEKLACVTALPLDKKIAQKLMAAGYAAEMQDQTATFAATSLGGIIMMDEASPEQIALLRDTMPIPPFIATDQEGGDVQRYKSSGSLPGASQMATDYSADQAYQRYLVDSQYLQERGLTTNFAPVVDVISRTPNPLPGRMYSEIPATVADYAAAHIRAAKDAGLTPVIKHFPGLGSGSGNTDFEVASTDSLSALWPRDLVPYQELASLYPDVMVGNMIVPELTHGQPAIWSPEAVTLLRSLGYENAIVYSDSLTAEAIPGNTQDAALKSWVAGIDVVVIVQADTETPGLSGYLRSIIDHAVQAAQSDAIAAAHIDESVLRIFDRKGVDPCQLSGL